jgi:alkylation response protein AidB-like acyl-CoA dehydrogenase
MPASRVLPTAEAAELIDLVRTLAAKELAQRVDQFESDERFPRDVFRVLGAAGLLGLAYPENVGGGGQPYGVYLQVLEEIASVWASVAVGVSVHTMSCFGLAVFGTPEQQEMLPQLLDGEMLGAYCLSEPHAGSDPAAMTTRAERDGGDYILTGAKAWTTHGGHADFYQVMARTSTDRTGISCFFVPADTPGLSADPVHAENAVRAGQAAWSYWWRTPPRRSRRSMLRWASRSASVIGSGSDASGLAFAMPWCGR